MNFNETIRELEKRGIFPESAPDLTRTKEALKVLGLTELIDKKKSIVVAGTNGKGSTCAALSSLLRHGGLRVGFYSSPHLVSYCERIKINDETISESLFCKSYEAVTKPTAHLKLTHFEVLTLMAAWIYFGGVDQKPMDMALFEVGLGGRWDATNALPHDTSVITQIHYDHQNLLGNTLSQIAQNKLGIIRDQSLIVHQPFPAEVSAVVSEKKKTGTSRWVETPHYDFRGTPGHPPQFFLKTPWGETLLSLAGARGAENASLALTVFKELGFDPALHLQALSEIQWPGRMDFLGLTENKTPIYSSGDHNVGGVESLLSLLEFYPREKLFIVIGIGRDKERDKMLQQIFSIPKVQVFLTETPFKATKLEDYGGWLKRAHGAFKNPEEALAAVKKNASKEDMILVTGSLYLVGALRTSKNN